MFATKQRTPSSSRAAWTYLGLYIAFPLLSGCGDGVKEGAANQSADPPRVFAGTFQGKLGSAPVTLTLEQVGDQVSGRLASGQQYSLLKGKAIGNSALGRLEDTDDNQSGDVQLVRDGDSLTMALTIRDPASKSAQTPNVSLQRAGASPARTATTEPVADASEHDSRLVGRWRHTDAARSGNFTYAVDSHFTFNEDGTYRYGDSKAGAGDAGSTAIANSKKVEVGEWRTENKVLFLRPDGNPAWTIVGRYAVDATHLMLAYKNGSKKIWERE